jgi:hypothetical protein
VVKAGARKRQQKIEAQERSCFDEIVLKIGRRASESGDESWSLGFRSMASVSGFLVKNWFFE